MGKRFEVYRSKDDPAWPLDLGLGPNYPHVIVHDKKTDEWGEGWGETWEEAEEEAWEDLLDEEDDC